MIVRKEPNLPSHTATNHTILEPSRLIAIGYSYSKMGRKEPNLPSLISANPARMILETLCLMKVAYSAISFLLMMR